MDWIPISKNITEELKEIEKVSISVTMVNKVMIYQVYIACRT